MCSSFSLCSTFLLSFFLSSFLIFSVFSIFVLSVLFLFDLFASSSVSLSFFTFLLPLSFLRSFSPSSSMDMRSSWLDSAESSSNMTQMRTESCLKVRVIPPALFISIRLQERPHILLSLSSAAEFRDLTKAIDPSKTDADVDDLLNIADPFQNNQLTFSECVAALSGDLVQMMGEKEGRRGVARTVDANHA